MTITKCLTPEFDISECVKSICGCLTGRYLVFIDAHFLIQLPNDEEDFDDKGEVQLKFQQGSKASSFNSQIKIGTNQDYDTLVSEFENKTLSDILNLAFEHHKDLFDYYNSGLRPYSLLSLLMHIQKFPTK